MGFCQNFYQIVCVNTSMSIKFWTEHSWYMQSTRLLPLSGTTFGFPGITKSLGFVCFRCLCSYHQPQPNISTYSFKLFLRCPRKKINLKKIQRKRCPDISGVLLISPLGEISAAFYPLWSAWIALSAGDRAGLLAPLVPSPLSYCLSFPVSPLCFFLSSFPPFGGTHSVVLFWER